MARLAELRLRVADVDVRPTEEGCFDLAHALDLRAGLAVAEATLRGALARQETRGCHNRLDHPALDDAMTVNFFTRLDGDALTEPEPRPVPETRLELRPWVDKSVKLDVAGRLLE